MAGLFSSLFIVFAVICLNSILAGNGGELFRLGNTPIPKLLGAGATYYNVFFMCLFGVVAVLMAVISRYIYYRKYIEELRSRGITDLDEDGNVDSFADRFLDEDI